MCLNECLTKKKWFNKEILKRLFHKYFLRSKHILSNFLDHKVNSQSSENRLVKLGMLTEKL